jgi:hypothetical protein
VGTSEVEGYLLGVVIDYHAERGLFSSGFVNRIIYQVVTVSQPGLKDHVGRILSSAGPEAWMNRYRYFSVVQLGGVHWQDYLPSGRPEDMEGGRGSGSPNGW